MEYSALNGKESILSHPYTHSKVSGVFMGDGVERLQERHTTGQIHISIHQHCHGTRKTYANSKQTSVSMDEETGAQSTMSSY